MSVGPISSPESSAESTSSMYLKGPDTPYGFFTAQENAEKYKQVYEGAGCEVSTSTKKLNDVDIAELVRHCQNTNEKMYLLLLPDGRSFTLQLITDTREDYDKNIALFEQSFSTLKLAGVSEQIAEVPQVPQVVMKTSIHKVVIDDKPIDLKIDSSSIISDFNLNEENKQISFTVSGDDGTEGTTIIPISTVLEGPYTVTIDGKVTTDFETIEANEETSIKLTYHHSSMDVTITGTQVVPEFSTIATLVLAASIVAIIALRITPKKWISRQLSSDFV